MNPQFNEEEIKAREMKAAAQSYPAYKQNGQTSNPSLL